MIWKELILVGLAVFVAGDGHTTSEQKIIIRFKPQHENHGDLKYGSNKPEHHEEKYAWSYPSYEFYYKVDDPHTQDKKGQKESREGDEVKGEYWLYEPDGRKRTVEYYSDKKSGFNAVVKYSGPHKHDHHKQKHYDHYEKDHQDVHHDEDHYDDHHHQDDHHDVEHKHKDDYKHKDDHEHKDDYKNNDDHKHKDDYKHKEDHKHKDDYKNNDDHKHKDDHKDENKQDDYKDHNDNIQDEKRGHSSQIMPYLEQYRLFPNRQASIKYDVPYPEQKHYRRYRKQL